jgi:DNA-binding XRE family transcriptional regulator
MPKDRVCFHEEDAGLVPVLECLTMSKEQNEILDAISVPRQHHDDGAPVGAAEFGEERAGEEVGRKIYELRKQAGLTQAALARLIGTTGSVISRLEDSEYEGHSLSMLKRIAAAVNKRLEIHFV